MAGCIVAIGTSAGGLEALCTVVGNLPVDSGLTFLVAQHMPPQHRSLLSELLGRETRMPVVEVAGGERPESDRIYVCPPNADLTYDGEILRLTEPSDANAPKPSIDTLFNSIAAHCGECAAGVILSGNGADGSLGSRAIRAAGGLTVAQDPATAQYEAMPQAAITNGGAELILTPDEIGGQIARLLIERRTQAAPRSAGPEAPDGPLGDLFSAIWQRRQLDFSAYKDASIRDQLDRRLAALQLPDLDAYLQFVAEHPEEIDALTKGFLVTETTFFHDTEAFAAAAETVDAIVAGKADGEPIRVWVPGCATGEQVYAIAMLVFEAIGGDTQRHPVKIFGTDIDADATAHARRGRYSADAVDGVEADLLERYFTASGDGYQVARRLQQIVVFARQDLVRDPPFLHLDLIACRNVLNDFRPELQDHLFRVFHYALNPAGHLLPGNAEAVSAAGELFRQADNGRIFVRDDTATASALRLSQFRANHEFAPATATPRPSEAPPDPRTMLHEQLARAYAPPSALVDADNRLVELFGATEAFFRVGEGSAEPDVLNLIRHDLRSDLRALLHRARSRRGETAVGEAVFGDDGVGVRLCVAALDGDRDGRDLLRVSFDPVRRAASTDDTSVAELHDELSSTRDFLQTVVEELETSNQELRSSTARNATSNEQMHATNAELSSVNNELQTEVDGLRRTLTDLERVHNASAVATVVVDRDLLVTRFNEAAVRTVGLSQDAVGHNLTALPLRLPVADLYEALNATLREQRVEPLEVSSGGRDFRIEMQPYRDDSQRVDGVVIDIADISQLKNQQHLLRETNALFEVFANHVGAVTWVQEPKFGRMIYVNAAFRHVYGLDPEAVMRDPETIFEVMQHDDAARLKQQHLDAHDQPWSLDTRITHPRDGTLRWLSTRAYPVIGAERPRYVVGLTVDITDDVESRRDLGGVAHVFDLLLDSAADGVVGLDAERRVTFVNDTVCQLTGVARDALVGQDAAALFDDSVVATLDEVTRAGERQRRHLQRVLVHAAGDASLTTDVVVSSEPLLRGGDTTAIAVVGRPREERMSTRELQIAANVFRNTQDGVMVLDDETRIVAVNPALTQILHRDEDLLIGSVPDVFPNREPHSAFPADIRSALDKDGRWSGEVHTQRSDAEFIVLESEVRTLDRTHGEDEGRYMVVVNDITQRRAYDKAGNRQANFDALTGLPNRTLLHDRLSLELRHAARDGYGVTVMFIDLDRFKEVNDSLGQEAGDELLLMVASRIQERVRSTDTLSRFGGDVFVLMMPKYQRSQAPELMARTLIDAVDQPFEIRNQSVFVSASIGIAIFPHDGNDTSELLRNADAAMYEAKNSGRRGFAFYQPQMTVDATERINLEAELRQALEMNQLRVHYQPIVLASNGRTCGMEALVRWQHPELGLLPPADFIPYAEEVGLVEPITRFVLADARHRLTSWRKFVDQDFSISVNFSARLFRKAAFHDLLRNCDGDLEGLTIEVTEGLFIDDRDTDVIDSINRLKECGAQIALDDFGTGFSSLAYVRRFPVDMIKIDRSFVADAPDDPRDGALVEAAVAMAHGLGATVVAEGVETERQASKMRALGADLLQGYLFAKPMPPEDAEIYLARSEAQADLET
ncbi:MAG: EAL domain-containing protein [Gammaproteobacteria bacterium]|nr:EAL domain-containing protein [Gammaproteobacteria bacterium]